VGSVQDPAWHLAGANADGSLHGSVEQLKSVYLRTRAARVHMCSRVYPLAGSMFPIACDNSDIACDNSVRVPSCGHR